MRIPLRFLNNFRAWALSLASSLFWLILQMSHTLCEKKKGFCCPAQGNSSSTLIFRYPAKWLPWNMLSTDIFLHCIKSRFKKQPTSQSEARTFSECLQMWVIFRSFQRLALGSDDFLQFYTFHSLSSPRISWNWQRLSWAWLLYSATHYLYLS